MGLFDRYHVSLDDAEARLKRPLGGDPSRGEIAVVICLNSDRLDDARRHLSEDPGIKPDFREWVDTHMATAASRGQESRMWNVRLPRAAFQHYATQARLANSAISECLEGAILRDFERYGQSRDMLQAVDDAVRTYHAATVQLLDEVREAVRRVGPLQDLSMRLGRIEAAVARR